MATTFLPNFFKDVADVARGLALARACADGGDGNDGLRAFDHGLVRSQQLEVHALGDAQAGEMADGVVGDIRIGENSDIGLFPLDDSHQLVFIEDGNSTGVKLSR